MRKSRFVSLLIICFSIQFYTFGQVNFGHEWIDPSKPHYKIPVNTESIFRISFSYLQSNCPQIASADPSEICIYNNGKQIPIFLSWSSAPSGNDYIEFFGTKLDGTVDKKLYQDSTHMLNPHVSLFRDTNYYILTLRSGNNLRFLNVANDTTSMSSSYLNYFWFKSIYSPKTNYNEGKRYYYTNADFLFAPLYEIGEGWGTTAWTATTILTPFPSQNPALRPHIQYRIAGRNELSHKLEIKLNNTKIHEDNFAGSTTVNRKVEFDLSLLTNGNASLNIAALLPNNHGYCLGYIELKYPRLYNLSGLSTNVLRMSFPTSSSSSKFFLNNYNSVSPVILYDIDRKTRILHAPDAHSRFAIPACNENDEFILSHEGAVSQIANSSILNIPNLSKQGDFIIITDRSIAKDSNGVDVINEYAAYKESSVGGGYKVSIAYMDEIASLFSYGIPKHPLGIKKFLQWAYSSWGTVLPKYVLLIGKGYTASVLANTNQTLYNNNLIPSFGHIASDYLYTTFDTSIIQYIPIGRISASNPYQIRSYLNKLKLYDTEYDATTNVDMTPSKKEYLKWAIHLGGGQGAQQQAQFRENLRFFESKIKDTSYGARIFSVFKNNPDLSQSINEVDLNKRINDGTSLITFFGHSSATIFDVGISDPTNFTNYGKYPVFLANGCNSGFVYGTAPSYSENFINLPNRGAISFIATTNFSLDASMYQYCDEFYNQLSSPQYNSTVGNLVLNTSKRRILTQPNLNYINTVNMEYNINGDPSVRFNQYPKPDYYIDANAIILPTQNLNTTVDSFPIKIIVQNLGKAVNAHIKVQIERVNNGNKVLYEKVMKAPYFKDTFTFYIPTVDDLVGIGQNTLNIKIDADDKISEISELNNEIKNTISLLIESDDVIPISPYEYSMVPSSSIKLVGMVTNSNPTTENYIIQIDTTELFNSNLLQTYRKTTSENIIDWNPNLVLIDSTVYYWRISKDSTSNRPYRWGYSSFIHLKSAIEGGWNQSHYYQFNRNDYSNITYKADRKFRFVDDVKNIFIRTDGSNGVYEVEWYLNNARQAVLREGGRISAGFMFIWIDGKSGIAKQSLDSNYGGAIYGSYGSIQFGYPGLPREGFVFPDTGRTPMTHPRPNTDWSTIINDFVSQIPNDDYVIIYTLKRPSYTKWDATLKNIFISNGFSGLNALTDSIIQAPFIFTFKKGNSGFSPLTTIGSNYTTKTTASINITGNWQEGYKTSVLVGPVKKWKRLMYHLESSDVNTSDTNRISLIGYRADNTRQVLATYTDNIIESDISWVDAAQFRNLQLELYSRDVKDRTPTQLRFWRIYYDDIGEIAVNRNNQIPINRDTIENGETYYFNYGVEGLSNQNFDSVAVNMKLSQGSQNKIFSFKGLPVIGSSLAINSKSIELGAYFEGENNIEYEINPSNFAYQREKFNINNYGKGKFFVKSDNSNPLLDVTFDGIRIIQNELVSNQPNIRILLKDDNKYLLLNDTNLIKISIRYPDGNIVPIHFNQPNLQYTLAASANNNQAEINYKPNLTDGLYQLIIEDKDRSGNSSSTSNFNYKIGFRVITKNQISQVFNYPNPFTSSTQFVFSLTGSKIPDQIKIQIMTIRGQIVKEINKEDLGPLRFGLNRTAYAWDGRDQYGSPLANGVYLYRVIVKDANINFSEMDPSDMKALYGSSKDLNQYFTNGWGKMVLIR